MCKCADVQMEEEEKNVQMCKCANVRMEEKEKMCKCANVQMEKEGLHFIYLEFFGFDEYITDVNKNKNGQDE